MSKNNTIALGVGLTIWLGFGLLWGIAWFIAVKDVLTYDEKRTLS